MHPGRHLKKTFVFTARRCNFLRFDFIFPAIPQPLARMCQKNETGDEEVVEANIFGIIERLCRCDEDEEGRGISRASRILSIVLAVVASSLCPGAMRVQVALVWV